MKTTPNEFLKAWMDRVNNAELLNFEARFNCLLDFARPAPILHHHSSQIPRMI
jgi:hypothetical protein